MGVWTNAWKAMDALGVGDSLRRKHQLLDGYISFIDSGHEVRCLQRKLLLEAMVKELPNGTIRYSSKLVSMEESGCFKLLHLVDGTVIKTKCFHKAMDLPTRSSCLVGRASEPVVSLVMIKSCIGFSTGHLLSKEMALQDNPSTMKEYLLSKLQNAPDMKKVVENTELDGMMVAPLRYRYPLDFLWKKLTKDNICVAGDALHPMPPDIGQGGCAALEDGVTLGRCLAEALHGGNTGMEEAEYRRQIQLGLEKYAKERRWRSLKLVTASCLVGFVQSFEGKIATFVRDRILAKFLAGMSMKIAEFDCGKLT
ncbi:Monooxygenase 3 [Linum perenne]